MRGTSKAASGRVRLFPLATLLLLTALAGCSDAPAAKDPAPTTAPPVDGPMLEGFVLDRALVPVAGAVVELRSEARTATTDEGGRFAFDVLPVGEPLVFVATAPGFEPLAKSVTLEPATRLRLDFALARVPVLEPYHETESLRGFLSCAGVAKGPTGDHAVPCAVGTDERAWDVAVEPGVETVLVEVAWTPTTDLAKDLNVTVESVGFGDQDAVLAAAEGPSVLRAQVPRAVVERYYADQGGIVRIVVGIGADVDANEAGVGAGAAFQQDFEVFVTSFYHGPAPAGFTVAG